MNQLELEYARKRKGKSKEDMAAAIGKSVVSYGKKERGEISFNDDEKLVIVRELDLTPEQFNTIFLTADYRIGKYLHRNHPHGHFTAERR